MPKLIFKGLTFALSGKFPGVRSIYEEAITKHGGEVAGTLTLKVDYLISTEKDVKAKTEKVVLALGRGVPILTHSFLLDSVNAGKLLDQGSYLIHAPGSKRKKSAAAAPAAPAKAKKKAKKKTETGPVLKADIPVIATAKVADGTTVVREETSCGFMSAALNWDAELVLLDPTTGTDRFYNMQVLHNEAAGSFYTVLNWGKTGMPGRTETLGPYDLNECKKIFKKKFRQKTGNVFGILGSSFIEKDGKYRLLGGEAEAGAGAEDKGEGGTASASAAKAGGRKPAAGRRAARGEEEKPVCWQYYLHNEVDGKKKAWYNYEKDAAANMEKFYQQYERDERLATRFIQTSYFRYEVDFAKLVQTNTKSGMRRVLRRCEDGENPGDEPPTEIPEPGEPDPHWKAKADEPDEDSDAEEDEDEDEVDEEEAAEEDEEEAPEPAASSSGRTAASPSKSGGGRTAPDSAVDMDAETLPMGGARGAPSPKRKAGRKSVPAAD